MKKIVAPALLGAAGTLVLASSALAATIDISPIVNEAITDVVLPVALAVVPVIGGVLVMPLRRFLDQDASNKLAASVDAILDKAVAYAAHVGQDWVADRDFHVNVNGWLASVAADYAVSHAPAELKKVGALAKAKAPEIVQKAAKDLLQQKIVARIVTHPAVADLKAKAPPAPTDVRPLAQAA